MPELDINTPVGAFYKHRQQELLDRFATLYPTFDVWVTDPDREATVDALVSKGGRVVAVMEARCRNMPLAKLRSYGSAIISAKKLRRMRALGASLCARVLLFNGYDDAIGFWTLYDDHGAQVTPFTEAMTEGQATCNGGRIVRRHAYLSLDTMKVLPWFD